MSAAAQQATILFEPWSLGDVIIAASALRELSIPASLACHPSWHPIMQAAFAGQHPPNLISVNLPYTTRKRKSAFDTAETRRAGIPPLEKRLILSIRGDPRDYIAARKQFPRATIRMNGWTRFLGRKSALVNAPYACGLAGVQNRYRSWAKLAGVAYEQIENTYQRLQSVSPRSGRVLIHLGAQWVSKQYPHVIELCDHLRKAHLEVTLAAGPQDPLPPGIDESEVARVVDKQLVDLLRSAEQVITNDSGPMHLAAFLGCRTTALVRTAPIEEWLPPATRVIASAMTPRGYRPHRRYMTDEILADWPPVKAILESLQTSGSGVRRESQVNPQSAD